MTPKRIAELRSEVASMTNSAGGPTRYGDWITELLDAVEEIAECQQCGHVECCCDPDVAPWINELRRLRAENAALSAGLDRALSFLSSARKVVADCICDGWPGNHEGFKEDCAIHGRERN